MKRTKLPDFISEFSNIFKSNNYSLFLVGGAVRNIGLGVKPKDWDFATNATPYQVMKIFRRVLPTGIEHGTVTVLFKHHQFEVTTFRIDGDYSDLRRPDNVIFTSDIGEDLRRRDFTINAMAIDISNGTFLDPHRGIQDLKGKCIRAVGDADKRFKEDALRILRAIRFSAQLDFLIEEKTWQGVLANRQSLSKVSVERIRDEFSKTLMSDHPFSGLKLLHEARLFEFIFPDLASGRSSSLIFHLFRTVGNLPSTASLELRLAALLHDIDKPIVEKKSPDGDIHYPMHAERGAETAKRLLVKMKFSNKTVHRVKSLIYYHMFEYRLSNDSAIRKLIARTGEELIGDLITLKRADILSKFSSTPRRSPGALQSLDNLENKIVEILSKKPPLTVRSLAVDGKDLMQHLAIRPGRSLGVLLEELLETVLTDPELNKKEKLLKIAENFYHTRLNLK